jgi:hypothetical protein
LSQKDTKYCREWQFSGQNNVIGSKTDDIGACTNAIAASTNNITACAYAITALANDIASSEYIIVL